LTVEPFRYAASRSNDRWTGRISSKSIAATWPLTPKKFRLVGSMKFALARRSAFGNEKPRSITPLTTLNIVVTPQIPRARTTMASVENDRSLRRTRKPMRRSWTSASGCIETLDERGGRRVPPPRDKSAPTEDTDVPGGHGSQVRRTRFPDRYGSASSS
jgi:hypothetical protein